MPNSPAINIPLNLGDNTFTIYGSHDFPDISYYGLKLAFNGVNVPVIAVFAPLQTSSTTVPPFSVNPSSAGSDSFISGAERVTLTDFRYAGVNVYNEDRVSPYSTVPDGRLDNVGQFTLNVSLVSAVPEPSSLTMLTMAVTSVLAGLGVARGRRIF
ncbi:MAG: PEP-CTERM sorting domain-containing protein, partial [Isosphaeraceae bacterium]